jgi:hypothetical protein
VKWTLQLSGNPFAVPSLEEEIVNDESLLDFVHDSVFTDFDESTEEIAMI